MKSYSYQERKDMLAKAIEEFPAQFGLRRFPGDIFRVSRLDSFVADDGQTVMIYTQVKRGDEWLSFAKGTVAELKRELVPIINPR